MHNKNTKNQSNISVGESVKVLREFQDLSQFKLSELTGVPQSTISAIENNKLQLGIERAKVLARVLQCHPASLVFPGWNIQRESADYLQ